MQIPVYTITSKPVSAHARSGVLESAQLKQCFLGMLTSVLPLLGLPSYNGIEEEAQPVAASPIAYAAKDCLQAICNLLGPSAYLGAAAQLLLSSSSTGNDAVHLAEVSLLHAGYSRSNHLMVVDDVHMQSRAGTCFRAQRLLLWACTGLL